MNYGYVGIDELKNFKDEHTNLSLGEIIYSSLRNKYTGLDIKGLYKIATLKDEEIYTCINTALKDEREIRDKVEDLVDTVKTEN